VQITVKSSKIAKSGENKNGKWSLIVVVDETTGIEYTTFDTKANAGPGAILDIGEPDVKDGKFSFKKCEVVSLPQPTASSNGESPGARSSMSPEDWERKDRLERFSIEAQSCFRSVAIMVSTILPLPDREIPEPLLITYKEGLEWARAHFKLTSQSRASEAKPVSKPAEAKKSDPDTSKSVGAQEQGFKNVGEFLTACQAKGVERSKVLELCQIGEKDLPKLNIEDAWNIVQEHIAKENKELWG